MSFLFLIILGIFYFRLAGRVRALEEKLGLREQHLVSNLAHGQSEESRSLESGVVLHVPAAPIRVNEPTWFDRFVEWVKEDWLLKLGALLVLLGFAWFAAYAFLNNWIGPMGRIALGIIAGTLFLVFGLRRIQMYIHQGGVFLVLGSSVILLTVYAAREIYGFFTPASALAVMFLSTVFVALASVRYNNRALALASIILAGVAPLLTNSPSPDFVALFCYLLVVVAGTLWVTIATNRRELVAAALLLVSFYSVPHILGTVFSTQESTLLLFAYVFAALFFITNTAGILKLGNKGMTPDLVSAAGNGLFLLAWITSAVPQEWQSLVISAWMVVFSAGAFLLFRATGRREPFYTYAGIGIAMLAAATAAELSGATLTIAYTVEAAAIALAAYAIMKKLPVALRLCLLLIWPVVLSLASMDSSLWRDAVVHKDFFVLLIVGATLFGLGAFFLREARRVADSDSGKYGTAMMSVGSLYAYILIWKSLHALFIPDDAVMFALLVYTLVGLACYLYGRSRGNEELKIYGGLLLGFVVGRLLLIEVWRMELTGRIITFFLVGGLLMSTAFLGRKKLSKV